MVWRYGRAARKPTKPQRPVASRAHTSPPLPGAVIPGWWRTTRSGAMARNHERDARRGNLPSQEIGVAAGTWQVVACVQQARRRACWKESAQNGNLRCGERHAEQVRCL